MEERMEVLDPAADPGTPGKTEGLAGEGRSAGMSEVSPAGGNEGQEGCDDDGWEDDGAPAPEKEAGEEIPEKPKGEPAAEGASDELFTLKNRDERRQVNRRELIAMAQKGWDYDTVRAERDQLRQYRQETGPALERVKANARRSGMTVPEYLDFCRKQDLMRGGLDERTAAQTLRMEKQKDDLDARQARLDAQARQGNDLLRQARARQEARRQDMERFVQTYPEVKAESIPREVWVQVARGVPLVSAYAIHENRQLKVELAAERQNRANRLRTPGTLGANSGAELDEMDRMWNEED